MASTNQNQAKDIQKEQKGVTQPILPQGFDIEELMNNPKFQEFLDKKVDEKSEEKANQKFKELIAMQGINRGEVYGKLISSYLYRGKEKTKKDDSGNPVPLLDKDGNKQFYDDKYYMTFSSEAFGEKQLEVDCKEVFEKFKDNEGEPLIIFYKLASNPFDPRAINSIVTNILTLSDYQSTLSK